MISLPTSMPRTVNPLACAVLTRRFTAVGRNCRLDFDMRAAPLSFKLAEYLAAYQQHFSAIGLSSTDSGYQGDLYFIHPGQVRCSVGPGSSCARSYAG